MIFQLINVLITNKVYIVFCDNIEIRDQDFDVDKNKVFVMVACSNPEKIRVKLRSKGGSFIQSIEIIEPEKAKPASDKPKKPEKAKSSTDKHKEPEAKPTGYKQLKEADKPSSWKKVPPSEYGPLYDLQQNGATNWNAYNRHNGNRSRKSSNNNRIEDEDCCQTM